DYRPHTESGFSSREALGEKLARSGAAEQRPAELAPEPDEQRLERERHRELELLGVPPGGPHDLAGPLGVREPLPRRIGPELREPVDVDDRTLGTRGGHDEIAVPPLELFERGEQLVPLGA